MPDFLHWKSDPLLLDPTPTVQNTWLTANIVQNQKYSAKLD